MTSGFKKPLCHLLGHNYHCSILEEVDGQLWATKEQCVRCGEIIPNTYYPVARLNMMRVSNADPQV